MLMAGYCKSKGMDFEQYKNYERNVNNAASAIYESSKTIHKHDTGVYYPLNDIIDTANGITDTDYYIIGALKKLGMEFTIEDNCVFYRA